MSMPIKCPKCGTDIGKVIAAHAGSSKSKAKKLASRKNGLLGGRPKGSKNKRKKNQPKE